LISASFVFAHWVLFVSLQFGTIEVQWFLLWAELESRDKGIEVQWFLLWAELESRDKGIEVQWFLLWAELESRDKGIEVQWFLLWAELESRDKGIGGAVIPTLGRIRIPGQGRVPYLFKWSLGIF
jgi:hypothetical protein